MKKTDPIEYRSRIMEAQGVAEIIAKEAHGLSDWRGIQQDIVAPSGLKTMANRWLKAYGSSNAIITEDKLGDGHSLYNPAWN